MNADRVLRAAGYDPRSLLAHISPVEPANVNVWPASRLLRRFWRPGISGVTIWKWVLVDPEVMGGDPDRFARLVIHELVHVRQFADAGYIRFMARYVTDYLRGRVAGKSAREAYLAIRAEREARSVTEQVVSIR